MRDKAQRVIIDPVRPMKYKQAEKLEKAASGLAGFEGDGNVASSCCGCWSILESPSNSGKNDLKISLFTANDVMFSRPG